MNCDRAATLLSAFADGELNWPQRLALRRHLRGCPRCAAQLQNLRGLRAQLRAQLPRYEAPAELRQQLLGARSAPAPAPRDQVPFEPRWRWLAAGALAGSAATLAALGLGLLLQARLGGGALVAEAVEAHVQAGLQDRLVQIASSDRHNVKPWLSARLDFSPPVHDLADEGYPLLGGRLDTLDGRPVAVLVYRRRLHTIDVFVRPHGGAWVQAPTALRGFHAIAANGADMDFLAVSDLNSAELQEFLGRLVVLAQAP